MLEPPARHGRYMYLYVSSLFSQHLPQLLHVVRRLSVQGKPRVTQGAGWHTHHARRYYYTLTASAAAAAFSDALSACAFNCAGTTVVSCLILKVVVALLDNAWHTLYLCSQ